MGVYHMVPRTVNTGKDVGHRHTVPVTMRSAVAPGRDPFGDPEFVLLFNTQTTNAIAVTITVSGSAFGYSLICFFRLRTAHRKLTDNFTNAGSPIAGWLLLFLPTI